MKYLALSLILVLSLIGSYSYAWDAELSWVAPTAFADGTPLNPATDIKGYKIYYGTLAGTYDHNIEVGNVTSHTITGITQRKFFFVATAIDQDGDESVFSNQVWKKVKIGTSFR